MIHDDEENTTMDDLDEREARLKDEAEQARQELVRVRSRYENLCDQLRAIRLERRERETALARAQQQAERRFGVRIDPTGHIEGSTYAGLHDTTEQVHKVWTTKAADRHRERGEGWRHEILTHAEWKQRAEPCLRGECGHDEAGVSR
jgi:hypothetical protein